MAEWLSPESAPCDGSWILLTWSGRVFIGWRDIFGDFRLMGNKKVQPVGWMELPPAPTTPPLTEGERAIQREEETKLAAATDTHPDHPREQG